MTQTTEATMCVCYGRMPLYIYDGTCHSEVWLRSKENDLGFVGSFLLIVIVFACISSFACEKLIKRPINHRGQSSTSTKATTSCLNRTEDKSRSIFPIIWRCLSSVPITTCSSSVVAKVHFI